MSINEAIRQDRIPSYADSLESQTVKLRSELDQAQKRCTELELACARQNDEVCQILGKALGYPWFKDDPKNFPDATEEDGVCVGDHVGESLAEEAAKKIAELYATVRDYHSQFSQMHDLFGGDARDYTGDGEKTFANYVAQEVGKLRAQAGYPGAETPELPADPVCFYMDGNKVCCVRSSSFTNLQESPAGFGDTVEEAHKNLLAGEEYGISGLPEDNDLIDWD